MQVAKLRFVFVKESVTVFYNCFSWVLLLLLLFLLLDRAAYQRTVNLGKRFLLEWCCTEIPNTAIDPRGPFLDL